MAAEVWTIRGVAEDVRKMAVEAAKARRLTLREWIEEAVRTHAAAKVEGPKPVQLDLVELVERLERLERQMALSQAAPEARQMAASASKGPEVAEASEPRQTTP